MPRANAVRLESTYGPVVILYLITATQPFSVHAAPHRRHSNVLTDPPAPNEVVWSLNLL